MDSTSLVAIAVLLFTGLFTYKGLRDYAFNEDYLFWVDPILIDRDWKRMFTSGFLHGSWLHFGFNMIALLSFATMLELSLGPGKLLLIYFASLLGGSLLSLYIHRHHGDYRALGASGAVSGVVFASVILFPDGEIGLILIPDFGIKSWIFGLIYLAISIWGTKNFADSNIGHDAHLGGALVGIVLAPVLAPAFMDIHWWVFFLLLVPVLLFLILIIRNPAVLMVDGYWGEQLSNWGKTTKGTRKKRKKGPSREEELNQLLQKIRQQGLKSLSREERDRLDELRDDL
jgi:membrane associated rhomboid family serine protease